MALLVAVEPVLIVQQYWLHSCDWCQCGDTPLLIFRLLLVSLAWLMQGRSRWW